MLHELELPAVFDLSSNLGKLKFNACSFRHDFMTPEGEIPKFCANRESENIGCAHVSDLVLKNCLKFLQNNNILDERGGRKILEVLSIVNLELGALDIWAQELDQLLRSFRFIAIEEARGKLLSHNLSLEKYLTNPELLRMAPQQEQANVVKPKAYIVEQFKKIFELLSDQQANEANIFAKKLTLKLESWLQQDENSALNFDWSN